MTHSYDANQRNVQLELLPGAPRLAVQAPGTTTRFRTPSNPRIAPPGHYMLFVLDANRIPSEAKIVHIGPE